MIHKEYLFGLIHARITDEDELKELVTFITTLDCASIPKILHILADIQNKRDWNKELDELEGE
jgi:hypothetical protein